MDPVLVQDVKGAHVSAKYPACKEAKRVEVLSCRHLNFLEHRSTDAACGAFLARFRDQVYGVFKVFI